MRFDPSVPIPLRAAAVIVALEALGVLGAAVALVVNTIVGSANNVGRALFAAAIFVLFAAVLAGGARGLLRLRPAARSPIVVIELLGLAVAYGFFQAGRDEYGIPVLVPAVIVLYLVFTPPARAALDRPPRD